MPKQRKRCWIASRNSWPQGIRRAGSSKSAPKGALPVLASRYSISWTPGLRLRSCPIGAVKGVEIGEGFRAADMLGSQNNDPITPEGYESNHAGGILGGISTGMDIIIRAAVKPIPSISKLQSTVDSSGKPAADQCKRPSRRFRHSKDHPGPGSHDPAGSGRFYAPSAAEELRTGLVSGHSHRQNLHRMHNLDMIIFQVAVNLHPASGTSCRNYVRARLHDGLNLIVCDS